MKPETMNEFLDEFGLIFFGHSAGETFCGWIWLNEVDGRRSMASINYYKSLEDFLDICLDEFLINIWTIFVTNPATVPESLSVVGGG
jgi:hypothetical protein